MQASLSFRKATKEDSEWLMRCTQRAYSVYIPILGRKPVPMTHDYTAAIDVYDIWIAECEGRRVGLLMLQHEIDHMVVYSVAVLPECTGQGIGRQLLAHAEEIALANGFELLRLYTNERMERNLTIYRRFGYVDSHKTIFKGSKVIHLKKSLPARVLASDM